MVLMIWTKASPHAGLNVSGHIHLTLTRPIGLPPLALVAQKMRISADSSLIRQKIGTFFQDAHQKSEEESVRSDLRKNSTLSPWKRRKTTSSAIFCGTK